MKPTFIDTSFLIALVLSDDALHAAAVDWQRRISGPLLTSEYVLLEFFDALAAPRLRPLAIETAAILRRDSSVRIAPVTTSSFDTGVDLFESRPDKPWGLTDCISFGLMTDAGVVDALTADRHFEQAGFAALLRAMPPK